MPTIVKITKKGQVTIPQKIRDKLNSEVVEFTVLDGQIVLRPVKSLAGALNAYADKNAVPFREAREKAWEEAVQERHDKKARRR